MPNETSNNRDTNPANMEDELREFATCLQNHHLKEAVELTLAIKRTVQTMSRWEDLFRHLGDDTANAVCLACRFMVGISEEDLTQSTTEDICKLKIAVKNVKKFVEAKSKPGFIIFRMFRSPPLGKVQAHRDNLKNALAPFEDLPDIGMYGKNINPDEEKPHCLKELSGKSIPHSTPSNEAHAHIPSTPPPPMNANYPTPLPNTARTIGPVKATKVNGNYSSTTRNTTTHNIGSGNVNTTIVKDSFNDASVRGGGTAHRKRRG